MAEPSPPCALVIVDVQPTFCEGGELGIDGGNSLAEAIAAYAAGERDRYAVIVTTQDWHIDPGEHFSQAPDFLDTWPPHGIAGTPNAELHPALAGLAIDASVKKGQHAAAYSGFEGVDDDGTPLAAILARAGVTSAHICGLAESHCVLATALDALAEGLATTVLTDLTVPVSPDAGTKAREKMRQAGVELRPSDAVNLG